MDDCVALPGVGPDEWSGAVIYRVSVRETALLLCDCTRGIYTAYRLLFVSKTALRGTFC